MVFENPNFDLPTTNVTVWRYMDFTKFIDLLEEGKLFFNRADKFEDPYEGRLRISDYNEFQGAFDYDNSINQLTFVNCWHVNESQSAAMWKLYLSSNNGIAVKSTFQRLNEAIKESEDKISITEIRYRDFSKTTAIDLRKESYNGLPESIKYKRNSFAHENELRLVWRDSIAGKAQINGEIKGEPFPFKKVEVDLDKLIDSVYVAPFAEPWFKNLVEKVVTRYGRKFPVLPSELYELK